MRHDDVIAARLERDPEFRKEWEASQSQYEFRRSFIRARIEAGFTQEQLAEAAGLRRSTIARIETGESNPRVDTLSKLAAVLGVEFHVSTAGVQVERELVLAD